MPSEHCAVTGIASQCTPLHGRARQSCRELQVQQLCILSRDRLRMSAMRQVGEGGWRHATGGVDEEGGGWDAALGGLRGDSHRGRAHTPGWQGPAVPRQVEGERILPIFCARFVALTLGSMKV